MKSISRAFLLFAATSLTLSACSLEPKSKYSRLHLSFLFPDQNRDGFENPIELLATSSSSPDWEKLAPTTVGAFPCYGVNVVGPGIADTARNPETNFNFNSLLTRQSYCTHRGIVSGPIYPNSGPIDVSLQIPSGTKRIVQVIGVTPAAACPTAFLADDSGGSDGDAYELGRVVADIFSDQSFTIPKEYPQGAGTTDADRETRRIDCGGGQSCPVTSGGSSENGGILITSVNPGAQRIVISQPTYLKQIDLQLQNPASAQNVILRVQSDSSGNPGTVVDATRGVATSSIAASVSQLTSFYFGTSGDYLLLSPATYWIVAEPASAVVWQSGAAGSPGQAKVNTAVGWTASSRISGVTMGSAGSTATCVVSGGQLRCAGFNGTAIFGDGFSPDDERPFFGTNSTLNSVENVSISEGFGCAVTTGGDLNCWGTNDYGQLGQGNTSTYSMPQVVPGLSGVTKVATGRWHTCARTSASAVRCWGYNTNAQIGDGTTTNRLSPVLTVASGASDVANGQKHSCAIVSGGVQCWGDNSLGQIGDSTNTNRTTPTAVTGLSTGVTAIAAGAETTCAIVSGGLVRCWGAGGVGQIGNGAAVNTNVSLQVTGLVNITQLAVGDKHACALSSAGSVSCWGENLAGQLGNGTTTGSNVPVAVPGLSSGVTAIFSGVNTRHTCAVRSGDLYCWGDNLYKQQGRGYEQVDTLSATLVRGADQFAHRFYSCSN